jgi:hypothetical protein
MTRRINRQLKKSLIGYSMVTDKIMPPDKQNSWGITE